MMLFDDVVVINPVCDLITAGTTQARQELEEGSRNRLAGSQLLIIINNKNRNNNNTNNNNNVATGWIKR